MQFFLKPILILVLAFGLAPYGSAQVKFNELRFITEEYPPYNYTEDGQLKGIAVDLLERAFALDGQRLDRTTIEVLPWARGYETTLFTPNTVLFSTTRTDTRESLFQWVGPISSDKVVLLAKKSRNIQINSLDDLKRDDLQIVVIHEDIGAQRLKELDVDPSRIHMAINNSSALAMLNANRVDLWAYGEDVAFWLMKKGGYDPNEFEAVFTLSEAYLYYALNIDTSTALVTGLQNAVDLAKEDLPQVRFLTENYPPFNYLNELGEVVGSATQLLQKVAKQIGLEVEFQLLPWARALTEAQMHENTCVYSTTRTPEREELFLWIGPLFSNSWAAYTVTSSNIQASQLDDIAELRVGSSREDAIADYLQDLGYELMLASYDMDNLARLKTGLIDVWVTSTETVEYLQEQGEPPLNQLFVFEESHLYLACNPSMPASMQRLIQVTLNSILQAPVIR